MRAQASARADLPTLRTMQAAGDLPMVLIAQDGTVSLNKRTVSLDRLIDKINNAFPKDSVVYIRPDKRSTWASVSQVIATLTSAKIPIKLVTD